MSDNVDLLKQIVTSVQKKNDKEQVNDTIRTKPAKVIGVDEETYKVFVYFLEDTEQKEYTFYNKSGEILSDGDTVKVFYTTNVAKGWIGARNGEPSIREVIGGVGKPSEWDKTSEYFNCYTGSMRNIAGNQNIKGSHFATARGLGTKALGYYSSAEGLNTKAVGDKSHAEGNNNYANGDSSHAEGASNQSNGFTAHTEGFGNTVSTDYGHAEGEKNTVSGTAAHAEGGGNTVSGFRSHAEGNGNTASGICSHAEGEKNTASDYASHAEGLQSQATGRCSHAEGDSTTASGGRSHSEGYSTKATAEASHSEGQETEASGRFSHSEGFSTKAIGEASHSEGYQTQVSSNYSFAGGLETTVDGGVASFGFGKGVIVANNSYYSRFYIGSYNDYSSWNTIFAIGNGTGDSNRSNAFAVDHDGNVYCKSINGIPINSENSYTYTPYSTSEAVESAKTIFKAVMGG